MDKKLSGPRASIVIIAYNREKYIDRAVGSACAQTEQNIEIVCVDDGSTDSTLERVRQWAARDERIRVITQPNGGTLSARYAGIQHAAGKYTLFLDSDDVFVPDAVKTACDAADECGADVLEFGVELAADADNPPDKNELKSFEEVLSRKRPLPEPPRGSALINACFGAGDYWGSVINKVFRTRLLCKALRCYRGEWLCASEDQLILLMALCFAERYARIGTKLYVYTRGSGMTSNMGKFSRSAEIKIWATKWLTLKLARQWLEEIGYPVEEIAEGMRGYAAGVRENAVLDLVSRCTPENRAEYLGWLSRYCTEEELLDLLCEVLKQYDAISNATFWKITAPLRFLVGKLRGNR